MTENDPPKRRYRLQLMITANSRQELAKELNVQAVNYAYEHLSHERRDGVPLHIDITGGFGTLRVDEENPEMTPERYEKELDEWISGLDT